MAVRSGRAASCKKEGQHTSGDGFWVGGTGAMGARVGVHVAAGAHESRGQRLLVPRHARPEAALRSRL